MENDQVLRMAIADFADNFFEAHYDSRMVYHNLYHTRSVVLRSGEIAGHYTLSPTESFVVFAAAWFHDMGHLVHVAEGHETQSVLLMRAYFQRVYLEEAVVSQIERCILATRQSAKPVSLTEQIVRDADLYHLGTDEFLITNELVKQEIEWRNNVLLANWEHTSLLFLKSHRFYTAYCRKLLEPGKLANIAVLQKLVNRKKN